MKLPRYSDSTQWLSIIIGLYNAYSNDVERSLVRHIPTVVNHAHALTDRLAMLRNELYTVLQYTRTTVSPGPIRGSPICAWMKYPHHDSLFGTPMNSRGLD